GVAENDLLETAALAESYSSHPISRSLREALPAEPDTRRAADAQEIVGRGVAARVDGRRVLAGNAKLMQAEGIAFVPDDGVGTVVYVARDGAFLGSILIADEVKPHAADAVAALRGQGVRTVMLTGDSAAV